MISYHDEPWSSDVLKISVLGSIDNLFLLKTTYNYHRCIVIYLLGQSKSLLPIASYKWNLAVISGNCQLLRGITHNFVVCETWDLTFFLHKSNKRVEFFMADISHRTYCWYFCLILKCLKWPYRAYIETARNGNFF